MGAWSYGGSKSLGGFGLFTNNTAVGSHSVSVYGYAGFVGWDNPGSTFPEVARNESSTTEFKTWAPGQVILQPSDGDVMSIARWTDPRPGQGLFDVSVSFRRVEDITHNNSLYWVLLNGKVLASGSLVTLNQTASYNEKLTLQQGDNLDLVVGCEASSAGTDLNVEAKIGGVPDPPGHDALSQGPSLEPDDSADASKQSSTQSKDVRLEREPTASPSDEGGRTSDPDHDSVADGRANDPGHARVGDGGAGPQGRAELFRQQKPQAPLERQTGPSALVAVFVGAGALGLIVWLASIVRKMKG